VSLARLISADHQWNLQQDTTCWFKLRGTVSLSTEHPPRLSIFLPRMVSLS
jgi:hypothetical protein